MEGFLCEFSGSSCRSFENYILSPLVFQLGFSNVTLDEVNFSTQC